MDSIEVEHKDGGTALGRGGLEQGVRLKPKNQPSSPPHPTIFMTFAYPITFLFDSRRRVANHIYMT
jgi:hypothetical protein